MKYCGRLPPDAEVTRGVPCVGLRRFVEQARKDYNIAGFGDMTPGTIARPTAGFSREAGRRRYFCRALRAFFCALASAFRTF
ncbi:MAG: hypothetical protein M0P04_12055, partial [Syntrophales bacterium]|nr:hypothetical protein [Syntrophales bacterium]